MHLDIHPTKFSLYLVTASRVKNSVERLVEVDSHFHGVAVTIHTDAVVASSGGPDVHVEGGVTVPDPVSDGQDNADQQHQESPHVSDRVTWDKLNQPLSFAVYSSGQVTNDANGQLLPLSGHDPTRRPR